MSKKNKDKKSNEVLILELKNEINKLVQENEKLKNLEQERYFLLEQCQMSTKFHLENVKIKCGEILQEDVNYCVNLTKRILDFYNENN
jgi:hypothetical protein